MRSREHLKSLEESLLRNIARGISIEESRLKNLAQDASYSRNLLKKNLLKKNLLKKNLSSKNLSKLVGTIGVQNLNVLSNRPHFSPDTN